MNAGVTSGCALCATYPPGTLCHEHFWEAQLRPDAHPAVLEARELIREEERRRLIAQEDDLLRIWRAVVLSPTLAICRALLRGEFIPHALLDQAWLRRFRRRDAA